jgi:hypothetical protein
MDGGIMKSIGGHLIFNTDDCCGKIAIEGEFASITGSIFSNAYLMSLECLSGRKDSILDDIDDQVGAYIMYQDLEKSFELGAKQ